ncbi:MAG TPA: glycoside hydrolase family 2 protein [Hydrogenispora sp.]|nr:glycoside hydrolase family 2 protein [Hydrogenispora sp.]
MREIIDLNNGWYYKAEYHEGMEQQDDLSGFTQVDLPHTNIELPYNYFDEKNFQFQSCYKYLLQIPRHAQGKVCYLHFSGVMAYARVYLNGSFLGEHRGGYTPFAVRIDPVYDFDREHNLVTVMVDSRELEDIPPFGGQIDYLTYGGIYREVSLGLYDPVFIKNIKVETEQVLAAEKDLKVKVFLENTSAVQGDGTVRITLQDAAGAVVQTQTFPATLNSGANPLEFKLTGLKGIKLWDLEEPNLYEIQVELEVNGYSDYYRDRIGFRTAAFRPDGFYLNGKRVKIVGINRHQSYPYVGYAMPRRVQEKDAEILKNELHVNLVRTSHYPQSVHFLNKCDELGLLVFTELPGWQHIGGDQWKKVARENLREMIERDWNHPSIVLWGVRINESQDDDEFYTETNRLAKQLDPTRQTGGVRYITDSNLLEDVYTFNDFIHDGEKGPLRDQQEVTGLPHKVPYMVTEFNGHMFPTKRFDQEERQMEHSLRYLRILNAAGLDDSIAGTIGWCAFDYNTHKDFGAGDRICYHGVMDMFRVPKFASYVYKSQVSPAVEPVLEPVTFWARGERSIGGVLPLVIYTNCDYVQLQFGEEKLEQKFYPRREEYPGVPYPPVIIDYTALSPEVVGAWGLKWEGAVLTGYYRDQPIVEKRFCADPVPTVLSVAADDQILNAAQKDATRVVVKVLDQCGNLLPFLDEIIHLEVEGPGRIQGPSTVVLKGGAIAFWVETRNAPGVITITVRSQSVGEKTVRLEVV